MGFMDTTAVKSVTVSGSTEWNSEEYKTVNRFRFGSQTIKVAVKDEAGKPAMKPTRFLTISVLCADGVAYRFPRTTLRDKIELCLRYGRQIRTVYQFNLPGERADDFEELREDVEHFRRTVKKGSWAIPFIPNQPSAHTPLQWCVPHYSWEMFDRIQAFRTSLFGSKNTGIAFYVPAPLGGSKWFAQQIAEWIPITPEVARVVQKIPMRLTVGQMVAFLASEGVRLPDAFLRRDAATVFPWSNIITTGDDADKWGRYAYMVRKMATPRGQGLPADIAPAESAA